MVILQGEVWWACAHRVRSRLQASSRRRARGFSQPKPNRNRCVRALTANLRWETAPGNVALPARLTGLAKDSVANVSQIVALDRSLLTEPAGKLSRAKLQLVLTGIDVVLGR